jgi:hypothetical protein
MYWVEAKPLAETFSIDGQNGYLATITSAEENAFILNSVVGSTACSCILDEFWLGGGDAGGQWGWITGETWDFTNWASGEPNNYGVETALSFLGWEIDPYYGHPGDWNNLLPDDTENPLHQFWAIVEFGDPDGLINLVQWPEAEGGNDHWYAIVPQVLFWEQANAVASGFELDGETAYLATIASAAENQFLVDYVMPGTEQPSIEDQYWVGGREVSTGVWTWITGELWIYENWAAGEPQYPGLMTALSIWGLNDWYTNGPPGTFNDALHNDDVNADHKWWSIIEFGEPDLDTLINLVQWPKAKGGNDHWYAIVPLVLFWDQANAVAPTFVKDGDTAYLATITSAAENRILVDYVMPGTEQPSIEDQYWVGGREVSTGVWSWITGELWEYENWAAGEPQYPGLMTALSIWGLNDWYTNGPPGTFNDALHNDDVNTDHKWWSIIEWGSVTRVVAIDILPGVCPNGLAIDPFYEVLDEEEGGPLPVGKLGGTAEELTSVIEVAVLGTEEFDVSRIDPATILWYGLSPISWSYEDVGTPGWFDSDPGDVMTLTTTWINIYCANAFLDGEPLPPFAVIRTYDPQGVLCGVDTTSSDGSYGFLPIYGDDEFTSVDEGPVPGDVISVTINGRPVDTNEPLIWTENGDMFEVCEFTSQQGADECECNTEGPDGHTDLVLQFRRFHFILAPPGVQVGDNMPIALSGELLDGTPIWGEDCIMLMGRSFEQSVSSGRSDEPMLYSNYPNPFNPMTVMSFSLPQASDVRFVIYNVLGQRVTTLIDDYLEAGTHSIDWDSRNSTGGPLASGIYLYRLETGSFVETRKMVLLK